jgi:hypothetical protein
MATCIMCWPLSLHSLAGIGAVPAASISPQHITARLVTVVSVPPTLAHTHVPTHTTAHTHTILLGR